jgi:hypothetical protein
MMKIKVEKKYVKSVSFILEPIAQTPQTPALKTNKIISNIFNIKMNCSIYITKNMEVTSFA